MAKNSLFRTFALAILMVLAMIPQATAQTPPGGWIEKQGTAIRSRWALVEIVCIGWESPTGAIPTTMSAATRC